MIKDTAPIDVHSVLRTIVSVCTLLMLILTAAAAIPPVPYFSQCDQRWGSDRLGGDGPTICSKGCALTSAAMVMAYYGVDTDPQRLNDAIGREGYDATYCIYWSAVRDACHDEINQIEYDPGTVGFDTDVLNSSLDAGLPVIVHVYCPGYGGYWGGHFVVVTGRSDDAYYINDPGFATRSTLDDYPTRYGMRIFSGSPPDEGINKPLVGDWNGNGTDTTGIYNYTTANFSLDGGLKISFGISGDIPITGDWNGNGYDTIGVFRPSTAQFFLDYDNDGISDTNATLGVIGDIPVAGDWDGDGDDNIGVFRQNHSDTGLTMFFLDFDNSGGAADMSVAFGEPDDLPVIGDWDGDGDDNIGLYRSVGGTTGVFYLDIDNDGGIADIVTPEYGDLGDIPIAGDWDGDSDDNIGVYRPGTGEFFLNATLPDVSASKTVYVDDDFIDNPSEHKWDTIQEGVDDAADGDTVVVYAGEYCENVDVNKSIRLEGAGADVVTVTAVDASDHVFEVTADWVHISGFAVKGAMGNWQAGIRLSRVNYCDISDNNASNNYDGIRLYSSNNNILYNNTASNNDNGIRLGDSSNNTLTDNTVNLNTWDGIYLWTSSNNTLTENTMSGNTYNFGVRGFSFSDYIHNIDTSNTVDGKPIYYWVDQEDKTIPSDAGFVGVVNCTNITVRDLTLTKNYEGVLFACTKNSRVENVFTSNNDDYGICMYSSSNNTLIGNTANSNNRYGICLDESSDNNTLTSNTANSNSLYGIHLEYSSDNTLQSNTMSGNKYNFGVNDNSHSSGTRLLEYIQNIDTSNMVDGKPIYYWVDQEDKTIPSDAGFVGVVNCTNITVRDLSLTNNRKGIFFAYTKNSRIDNVSTSNNGDGIELSFSSNNMLTSNNVSNNWDGIFLWVSSNNTLQNNTALDNGGDGIGLCAYSNNNTLMDNTALNNRDGIDLDLCSNNNILQSNIASNNDDNGIELCSSNNTLSNNTANSNNDNGIELSGNNNTLTSNNASDNYYGISMSDSSNNNTLYHNNLIGNIYYNAYDPCTNTWDSGSEGNYYSDYTGTDPDGDGIGEDPHPIPGGGGSVDNYPLMQPWTGATSPKGDLNGDDQITPADAAIALRLAAGGSAPCDPATLSAADVSGDGRITSLDALMILQAATDR